MAPPNLTQIFREEAREHLDALERQVLALESGGGAPGPAVDECFRRAHTLKGAARAAGFRDIQDAAHAFEERLAPYRGRGESPPAEILRDALARIDALRRMTEAATASPGGSAAAPAPDVRVEADRLDRLVTLLGNAKISARAAERAVDESRKMIEILESAFGGLDGLEAAVRQGGGAAAPIEEVRLSVRSACEGLKSLRAVTAARQAEGRLILDQMDDELTRARLLPVSSLRLFLERACLAAADERRKQAVFELRGGDATLDRAVIGAVQEPLMHLVRNAVAHGIEPAEVRRRAGKPPEGRVTVEANRRGNRVSLRVADDGGGVDLGRLREAVARAERRSLDEMEQMPRDAVLERMFRGGVTTAAGADPLSGRGAGLEIVRTRLRAIQGDVRLVETGPAGTVFECQVPVNLQVMRVLVARVPSGLFGIPSAAVLRLERVREGDARMLEGRPALALADGPVRLVSLETVVGGARANAEAGGVALVLAVGGERVAVRVAEVADETEAVIRDLGFPFGPLRLVAGAAVQADGSVLLILNPAELGEGEAAAVAEAAPLPARPRVLIVDDSPTTRSVLRGLFSAAGFEVTLASDGLEGHRVFLEQGADVVLADIQMPRMDGFALTRAVKSSSAGGVPVVLVTGRESEADRREGLEAGADAYVVKSTFEGSDLLEIVRRFL